jgi:hypothetical protein
MEQNLKLGTVSETHLDSIKNLKVNAEYLSAENPP